MKMTCENLKNFLAKGTFVLSTVALTTLYSCGNTGGNAESDANTTDTTTMGTGTDGTGMGTDTTGAGMGTDTAGTTGTGTSGSNQ